MNLRDLRISRVSRKPAAESEGNLDNGAEALSASPRVCIVGAGAVGLVYAQFLRRAGAEVALLVKPEYADICGKGFTLHQPQVGRALR